MPMIVLYSLIYLASATSRSTKTCIQYIPSTLASWSASARLTG